MKNATPKQIAQIKTLTAWEYLKFHGNLKTIGHLKKNDFVEIVTKKRYRRGRPAPQPVKTAAKIARELVEETRKAKGTPYFKKMIEGSTGIYYASPMYEHRDYNKTRLFDKSPRTLEIMEIFNKIVSK